MNNKTFMVPSRYNEERFFEIISDSEVIFTPNCEFCRFGSSDDFASISMVDPSGGPYLAIGSKLRNTSLALPDKKITAIESMSETPARYKLTVEDP